VSYNDYYHYCLLLLSGDVALNPGPVKFPCVVCHFPVRSNQCALLCDECATVSVVMSVKNSINLFK